jgi:hypothetical protein
MNQPSNSALPKPSTSAETIGLSYQEGGGAAANAQHSPASVGSCPPTGGIPEYTLSSSRGKDQAPRARGTPAPVHSPVSPRTGAVTHARNTDRDAQPASLRVETTYGPDRIGARLGPSRVRPCRLGQSIPTCSLWICAEGGPRCVCIVDIGRTIEAIALDVARCVFWGCGLCCLCEFHSNLLHWFWPRYDMHGLRSLYSG